MSTVANNESLSILDLPDERRRGLGALSVMKDSKRSMLPLAGVDIKGRVADRVAEVTMKETFHNPHSEHLEAVYIFPLPGGCAVSNFEMKVGDRIIKGKVEERGEARAQYQQALQEGKRAALLEQERDDVFTVQVGNLPPGEEVTVILTYSERLPYFDNGATELRLPMVVAPRYIAGQPNLDRPSSGDGVEFDTDIVRDASRITPPRLVKGFDPKVSLNVSVDILADETGNETELEDLACSQHATKTKLSSDGVTVSLSRVDEHLDRDFVLRWHLGAKKMRSTFLFYRDPAGKKNFGMISILPPTKDVAPATARDVIFVVDRSGSMGGVKMASAARACSLLLATLGPQDRFAIQAFDNTVEWLSRPHTNSRDILGPGGERFFHADEQGLDEGNKYLRQITARGGTELYHAMADALMVMKGRSSGAGRMPVIVLLTDGQVGDESRVLKEIQSQLGDNRVFTVGIDTAVNEGFLKRLATLGGGTSTFVAPGAQLETALNHVGREIGMPLVTDLNIEDISAGLDSATVAPKHIPDLFVGRATTCFFSFTGDEKSVKVRVKGRYSDGNAFVEDLKGKSIPLGALAQLWAKAHVADLEDSFRIEVNHQDRIKKSIIDVSVAHRLLTRFTAFVVVDESEVVNKDGSRRTVVQPVEMPAQWEEPQMGGLRHKARQSALPTTPASSLMGQLVRQCKDTSAYSTGGWDAPAAPSAPAPPAQNAPAPAAPPSPGGGFGSGSLGSGIASGWGSVKEGAANFFRAKPIDFEALKREFAQFEKAVRTVFEELKNGRMPDHGAMERARRKLLEVLSQFEAADKLPGLQRYLRSDAVTIIAFTQQNGITVTTIREFATVRERQFEEIVAEFNAVSKGGSAGGANFWESSV